LEDRSNEIFCGPLSIIRSAPVELKWTILQVRIGSCPSRSITTETLTKTVNELDQHYSVTFAILVYAPTLEGWYLLQGPAVAISCTTAIYELLFSGVSRRD
jgi:hypothetical protein